MPRRVYGTDGGGGGEGVDGGKGGDGGRAKRGDGFGSEVIRYSSGDTGRVGISVSISLRSPDSSMSSSLGKMGGASEWMARGLASGVGSLEVLKDGPGSSTIE